MTCNICCEKYNKSLNAKVTCICGFVACKTCVRTYLLSTTKDPHCMDCKIQWSAKFLVDNLNRSYIDGDYKKHRKSLLVDREISRTPDLMNLVERTKLIEEKSDEMKILDDQFKEAKKLYDESCRKLYEKRNEITRIKRGDTNVERKKFIMPCPGDNCKGYLSTQYKCEVCKLYTCPDCYEIVGYTKEDPHTCLEANLQSAALIKKETKGCPQCGVRIYKISGCFAGDTPILMYDGSLKSAKNISLGDQLIGDDGNIRNVTHLMTGYDKMYKIQQNNAESYIVNSEHTLVLYYAGQGKIGFSRAINMYKLSWFDTTSYQFKTRNFDSLHDAEVFKKSLNINYGFDFNKAINIPIKEYLKLPESRKETLKGFRIDKSVNWEYKEVHLDPYILGTWLGDGYSNGKEFCTNDFEILDYWENWASLNDAKIIKTTNPYRYYVKNILNDSDEKVYKYPNPLKQQLDKYQLVNNKYIPNDYLINSKDVRLKILAGLIDTDGCVQNNGRRIVIITTIVKMSKNIEFLARSLGYNVNITIRKPEEEYKDQYVINISGENIHEIPTILPRKKCEKQSGGVNLLTTAIKVTEVNYDNFYGWTVDNNHRFLLGDFTVAKNCDQMWCTECKVAFSWNTGKIVYWGQIHNPHYYQYMRNQNQGGPAPRNPGDVLCGGLIPYYTLNSFLRYLDSYSQPEWFNTIKTDVVINTFIVDYNVTTISQFNSILLELHRVINHLTNVNLVHTREKVRSLGNNDELTVQYILNRKTKEELSTIILKNDTSRKKHTELLNIYELLSVVGIEKFNNLSQMYSNFQVKNAKKIDDLIKILHTVISLIAEYNTLLEYCNKQSVEISRTYNQSVTLILMKGHKYELQSGKFSDGFLERLSKRKKGNNNSEASSSTDN